MSVLRNTGGCMIFACASIAFHVATPHKPAAAFIFLNHLDCMVFQFASVTKRATLFHGGAFITPTYSSQHSRGAQRFVKYAVIRRRVEVNKFFLSLFRCQFVFASLVKLIIRVPHSQSTFVF